MVQAAGGLGEFSICLQYGLMVETFFFFFFGAPLDSSGTWNSVSDIWSLQKWLHAGSASPQSHDK